MHALPRRIARCRSALLRFTGTRRIDSQSHLDTLRVLMPAGGAQESRIVPVGVDPHRVVCRPTGQRGDRLDVERFRLVVKPACCVHVGQRCLGATHKVVTWGQFLVVGCQRQAQQRLGLFVAIGWGASFVIGAVPAFVLAVLVGGGILAVLWRRTYPRLPRRGDPS